MAMLQSIRESLKHRLGELNENLKNSVMNGKNDEKRRELDRQVKELE